MTDAVCDDAAMFPQGPVVEVAERKDGLPKEEEIFRRSASLWPPRGGGGGRVGGEGDASRDVVLKDNELLAARWRCWE